MTAILTLVLASFSISTPAKQNIAMYFKGKDRCLTP